MKKSIVALTLAAALGVSAGEFNHRWVYLSIPLTSDEDVVLASNAVNTAANGGMNGLLLSCGLDFLKFWPQDRFVRLAAIRKLCADRKMEIIPSCFSFGYGAMQNYGRNLIEAIAVEGVPFVVKGATIVYDESRATKTDLMGKIGWQREQGYRRAIIKADVKPSRRYRFEFEYKTIGLQGKKPFRLFCRNVDQKQYHECEGLTLTPKPTQDWTYAKLDFNSSDSTGYYLYVGYMSGWQKGDLDIRNARLVEIAPSAIVQRPGAPRQLRSATTDKVYAQDVDYTVPLMHYPAWAQDQPIAVLGVPAGSSLRDGDQLVLDCYAPAVVDGQQVSLCLSEPRLWSEIFPDAVARIEKLLHPKCWQFSVDEFRNGNWCKACRDRDLTMAEIYGDSITKMYNIVKKVSPNAEVHIWSDMLDPNHNSVANYYNCRGSFEDTWKLVPKDLVIDCWYGEKCETSLKFFSDRGFRTFAAAYYDEKPPFAHSRRWRDAMRKTPRGTGIMYTTWRKDYSNLAAFCDLLNEPSDASASPSPASTTSVASATSQLPDRWVYLPCNFWGHGNARHSLGFFTNVAARAKNAGYSGAVVSAHLDLAYKWVPYLSNQVIRAKAFCDAIGLEIIPMTWDVGYGGDCPGDWFESRTVSDMRYVRRGAKAVFEPKPVKVDSVATRYVKLEGVPDKSMPMRPVAKFTLKKGQHYVITVQAKSTSVPEKDKFQFIGFIPSQKNSAYYGCPKLPSDGAWHQLVHPLVAKSDEEVTLVFGHWGRVGTLELKDFTVRERGVAQVTRRADIPFVVKDAKTGRIYEEGRDYDPIPGVKTRGEGKPEGPYVELTFPAKSRIREGAELLVTADTPDLFVAGGDHGQYAACMSNREWYGRAIEGARAVKHLLKPKRWFLCFDELRSANLCAACRARNLDMAHLIGDCLTKQYKIVQKLMPGTKCYVWGDMLDPNHNANEGYAHTRGSYEGIAQCIPKDLIIVPWWGEKAEVQTAYWAKNGFKICPGAYYDQDSHEDDRKWLAASKKYPGVVTGFMFCTWKYNFDELEAFADLMFAK